MAKKPNGYVIHETDKIVVIATGFAKKSKNEKTGTMIQSWILVKAENPIAAVISGADSQICFSCPFRSTETGAGAMSSKVRACYVNITKAPLSIWKAYNRGNYPRIDATAWYNGLLFKDRAFRFGSYGEPVIIPMPIVKAITKLASNWTGYSHAWKNPLFQAYKDYFMASCTESDYQEAQAIGWRTFTVSETAIDKQVVCPASEEGGRVTSCITCGLCKGNSLKARSVVIKRHDMMARIDRKHGRAVAEVKAIR